MLNSCDDVYLAVREQSSPNGRWDDQVKSDAYITLHQSCSEHQDGQEDSDSTQKLSVLKIQLKHAEEMAQKVQREVRTKSLTSNYI